MKTLHHLIVASLFGLGASSLAAQPKTGQARIDSLMASLPQQKSDTDRVKVLGNVCFAYTYLDRSKGIEIGTQALELAKKIGWEKGTYLARYYRGSNYMLSSLLPQALDDYLAALRYFEKAGDLDRVAGLLSNIGGVYTYQRRNDKALEYYFKALKLNRSIEPGTNFEVANLTNIGDIYLQQKDFDRGLKYMLEAHEICKRKGYPTVHASVLSGLSGLYLEKKDYRQAIRYATESNKIAVAEGLLSVMANSTSHIGVALASIAIRNEQAITDSLYGGNRQKLIAAAQATLDSGIAQAEQVGSTDLLVFNFEKKMALEEHLGHYQTALEYAKKLNAANDTLLTSGKKEEMMGAAMQYEFDKKTALERAENEAALGREKLVRNGFIAGFALMFLSAFVLLRQRNKTKKARQIAEQALAHLKAAQAQLVESEKRAAFGEVATRMAHEIQNPLNFVNNFSGMSAKLLSELAQSTTKAEQDELIATLTQNLDKIKQHGRRAEEIVRQLQEHTNQGRAHEFFEQ